MVVVEGEVNGGFRWCWVGGCEWLFGKVKVVICR